MTQDRGFLLSFHQQVLTKHPVCGLGFLTVLGRQDLSRQKNSNIPRMDLLHNSHFFLPQSFTVAIRQHQIFYLIGMLGTFGEDPDSTLTLGMKERTAVRRPSPVPGSCVEADLEVSAVFSGPFPLAPLAEFSSDWFVVKGKDLQCPA